MNKIIEKLNKYNKEDICIISDFDDTLTKGVINENKRGSNSFSVFTNNKNLLDKGFVSSSNDLYNYYYDLEQNPNIENFKKIELMEQWWKKEFNLYKKFGLKDDILNKIIKDNLIEMKSEVVEFFKIINNKKVPLIIFSAGIYNLIHNFLIEMNCDFNDIHVVANIFNFKNNKFIGTTKEIIHSANKNFNKLSHLDIYSKIKNKKVCILLGDSVSDLKMVEGANFEEVISIGFLNVLSDDRNYNARFNAHRKNYDLVLDGREDFRKINNLLNEIFN